MRKQTLFLTPILFIGACAAWANSVEYTFTLNTSSIAGQTGSIDFALDPGAGSDQSLTAIVSGFQTTGGSYVASSEQLFGDASGGPVSAGDTLTLGTADADNEDLEDFKFGSTLSFNVFLSGPALTSPDGLSTSPYEFVFSTYSDAAGTVPVLTTDPNGISGELNVSPEAVLTTTAISPQLSITATPEPSALWFLCCALGVFGVVNYARRKSGSLSGE